MKRIEQEVARTERSVVTASVTVPDDAVVLSQPGEGSLRVAMSTAPFVLSEADRVAMMAAAEQVGEAGRRLAEQFAEAGRAAGARLRADLAPLFEPNRPA